MPPNFSNERDYYINGPTIIKVKGTTSPKALNQLNIQGWLVNTIGSESILSVTQELGLATGDITISLKSTHKDIPADDFGDSVPAEVLWSLAEARISMTLIHLDEFILQACLDESMGRSEFQIGYMAGAGTLMGSPFPINGSQNRYITLNIIPGNDSGKLPWRFPRAYLAERPVEIPLGTASSAIQLNWRAIPGKVNNPNDHVFFGPMRILQNPVTGAFATLQPPQFGEFTSNKAILWDHQHADSPFIVD